MSKIFGTVTDNMPLALNRDYGTFDGASVLAARISAYWTKRVGLPPHVMVVADKANRSDRDARFNVRSNMVGGWP